MGAEHRVAVPLAGLLIAALPVAALWRFTVDDALIAGRYAHHIATGLGHRFNPTGPVTDGVTPLPWPWLIAPFAASGVQAALRAAKVAGAIAWLIALPVIAMRIDAIASSKRWVSYLSLSVACGTPAIAAWSVAGMETGVAMGLATLAVAISRRRIAGSMLAGIVAVLRPEMIVWAVVIGAGHGWCAAKQRAQDKSEAKPVALHVAAHVVAAAAPFAIVALTRLALFGSVSPLALRAKPSDLQHGLYYTVATLLLAGPPLAVLAPVAWRTLDAWPRVILSAFAAHCAVVIGVGGDWMPMSRLFAPVLPSLALVFAALAVRARWQSTAIRTALCVAGQCWVWFRVGADASRVGADRAALIQEAAAQLRPQEVVAALDVGWVGVAHRGTVVDLAGLTDPDIASLPGGHTTKAVAPMLLADKRVDTIVLLLPSHVEAGQAWEQGTFARGVESRIARMGWVRDRFRLRATVGPRDELRYVIMEARPD